MSDSKQIIFNNFLSQYKALSDIVKSFPIPPNIQAIILQSFDTGYLWTKEAFNYMFIEPVSKENQVEVNPEPDQAA